MATRFIGIDFSGNASMWSAGTRRSNVWIAALSDDPRPRLIALMPVQDLPGRGPPFARLADLLAEGAYESAAIDAPLAVPAAHMPPGGWSSLVAGAGALPCGVRPFAHGEDLVRWLLGPDAGRGRKVYRDTERRWMEKGVNVRSTLWNGPRGGAPFTVAALRLLHVASRPVWPWAVGRGVLVEAFPAAQLAAWGIGHAGYNGETSPARKRRCALVAHLDGLLELATHRERVLASADALDAVLCALAARAVVTGQVVAPGAAATTEGEIAVALP